MHTFTFALTGEDLTYATCRTAEDDELKIYLDPFTRRCVQDCPDEEGNVRSLDGATCLTDAAQITCGEHQVLELVKGKEYLQQCACTNGFTLTADGQSCECTGYLDVDGASCVQNCTFAVHATEQRCVDECDSWYSRVEDGRCVEQTWRKSTAIAVPIVVVVAIVVVVLVIVLLVRRRKAFEVKPEKQKQTGVAPAVERNEVTEHAE